MPADLPILTRRHMAALGRAAREGFIDRLAGHVARVFPQRASEMDSPDAFDRLEKVIARAKSYGLTTERGITLFVDLVYGLGEDFDEQLEHRWIKNILSDPDQTDTGKMYLIYRDLRAQGKQ